jgi:hypothetical protein
MWILVFICMRACSYSEFEATVMIPNLTKTSCVYAANIVQKGRQDWKVMCLEQSAPIKIIRDTKVENEE